MRSFTIAIAGTHSTGKSTFLAALCKELESLGLKVGYVRELAVAARKADFGILREHSYESTLWIITRGISEELAAANRAQVVLVDRPVPDALGYLRAALSHRGEKINRRTYDYLQDITKGHLPRYDILYKSVLNPAIPMDRSKKRDPDLEFRSQVADCINDVFDELGVDANDLRNDQWRAAIAFCRRRVMAHFELTSAQTYRSLQTASNGWNPSGAASS
ncbi:MAG: AAA family ATPase [Myxococcota bacterium]